LPTACRRFLTFPHVDQSSAIWNASRGRGHRRAGDPVFVARIASLARPGRKFEERAGLAPLKIDDISAPSRGSGFDVIIWPADHSVLPAARARSETSLARTSAADVSPVARPRSQRQ